MTKIGFLGFGEAAYYIALGLHQEGSPVEVHAYDVLLKKGPESCGLLFSRAKDSGTALVSDPAEVIGWADLVIACTPSSYTFGVCLEAFPLLREGQLYADVSASTPATKKKEWELLRQKNIRFADAAMLGSLPQSKHRVPIIVSGSGTEDFCKIVNAIGMKAKPAGREAGDASAIKLLRSIFMKGVAALMLETTCAADACGVADEVVASVGKSLDGIPFEEHLTRLLLGTAIHGHRRAAELKGSVEMCEDGLLPHSLTDGSILWHEALSSFAKRDAYGSKRPEDWHEIAADLAEWLSELRKNDPENPLFQS